MTSLLLLGLSLFFLFPLLRFLLRSLTPPPAASKTPCPESYPFVGNLVGFLRNRRRFHDWVSDMISTTPSLTLRVNGFLGLSTGICTANPVVVDHLLRSNFPNYVKGSRFRSVLDDLLSDGIFNVDGELWFSQRKIASHEFSTRSLKRFISTTVQSRLSNRLIPYLFSVADSEEIVDLQEVLRKFTFDNICNIAFGVDPISLNSNGADVESRNSGFVRAFDYAVEVCSDRFMSPLPAIWKLKRLLNVGSERKYREAIGVIDEFAMDVIRSKEREFGAKGEDQKQDLLSRFMSATAESGFPYEGARRKFLRDIVISFILAGKDGTSTALTWFFWLVAGHPRCDRLIYSELSSSRKVGSDDNFGYDNLKNLHYLQAALSESMRLFPPVPINSRLALKDDVLPDGTRVGKGWFADYSAYAMGRMERLWGPDCREYKPERWLDLEKEKGDFCRPVDQVRYPVFHHGPRTCLGKDMAYVQMKSVAAAVLYEFEIEAVDGVGSMERMEDPPYTLSLLLKMRGGLRVRLKRRGRPDPA